MATLIPPLGELQTIADSTNSAQILRECAGTLFKNTGMTLTGPDRSEWTFLAGEGVSSLAPNPRAMEWMRKHGVRILGELRGPVLYVSPEETAQRGRPPVPSGPTDPFARRQQARRLVDGGK